MNFFTPSRMLSKACLMAAAIMLASPNAFAQQPVRFIVPYGAGGATDLLARAIAPALSDRLKQTVIVENRQGASGVIGLEYVAKAPPDGLTVVAKEVSILEAK